MSGLIAVSDLNDFLRYLAASAQLHSRSRGSERFRPVMLWLGQIYPFKSMMVANREIGAVERWNYSLWIFTLELIWRCFDVATTDISYGVCLLGRSDLANELFCTKGCPLVSLCK